MKPGPNRRKGGKAREELSENCDLSLFEIVKTKPKAIPSAVEKWVKEYEAEPYSGLLNLVRFLFESCGVTSGILKDEERVDEADVDELVRHAVEHAKEGNIVDNFAKKDKLPGGQFKQEMLFFWDCLVRTCQDGMLYDGRLLRKCMDFVIALSCTSPRPFRQAATSIGLQLVTSLVGVARTLCESRQTMQRQLNAEKRKRKEGARIEALNKALSETHTKITMVEEMMRKIVTGVFVHRYRDVDAEIRVACISSIGRWVAEYSSLFLQDLYLKYIGWTLNDKVADVRESSVSALCRLYLVEDNIPALGLFTERFSERMLELADDISTAVAVRAINLLNSLMRHQLLREEQILQLCELLVNEAPQIRHAVGELVYEHFIARDGSSNADDEQSPPADQEGKKQRPEAQIHRLLRILSEYSDDKVLCDYVIDALWDHTAVMQDWKCISELLLDDKPEDDLSAEDSANLLRVLRGSVKRSVGKKIVPVPRTETRRLIVSKAQKEAQDAACGKFTTVLMKALPQLLRKYLADKDKLLVIFDMVPQLDLMFFSLKRQESCFSDLLQLLKDAFFKHAGTEFLRSCFKALMYCAEEGKAELKDVALHVRKGMMTELHQRLKDGVMKAINMDEWGEENYSLMTCLQRLKEFQILANVGRDKDDVSDLLLMLLEECSGELPEEVVRLAVSNLFLSVFANLSDIDEANPDDDAVASLIGRRDKLLQQMEVIMSSLLTGWDGEKSKVGLATTICELHSDLWAAFCAEKLKDTLLERLGYQPSEDIVANFWKLCRCLLRLEERHNEGKYTIADGAPPDKDHIMSIAAKLVACNILPTNYNLGQEVLASYALYGKEASEIVKLLCGVVRKHRRPDEQVTLFLGALVTAYKHHLAETTGDEDHGDFETMESFLGCKDLANRLSLIYSGFAMAASRTTLVAIIKQGIMYAFTEIPSRLSFLQACLAPFLGRLPTTDVRDILAVAEKRVDGVNTDEDPNSWRPFYTFLSQARERCIRGEPQAEDRGRGQVRPPGKRKRGLGRGKGRKLEFGDDASEEERSHQSTHDGEEEEEEEEEEEVEEENRNMDDEESTPLSDMRKTRRPRFAHVPIPVSNREVVQEQQNKTALSVTPAQGTEEKGTGFRAPAHALQVAGSFTSEDRDRTEERAEDSSRQEEVVRQSEKETSDVSQHKTMHEPTVSNSSGRQEGGGGQTHAQGQQRPCGRKRSVGIRNDRDTREADGGSESRHGAEDEGQDRAEDSEDWLFHLRKRPRTEGSVPEGVIEGQISGYVGREGNEEEEEESVGDGRNRDYYERQERMEDAIGTVEDNRNRSYYERQDLVEDPMGIWEARDCTNPHMEEVGAVILDDRRHVKHGEEQWQVNTRTMGMDAAAYGVADLDPSEKGLWWDDDDDLLNDQTSRPMEEKSKFAMMQPAPSTLRCESEEGDDEGRVHFDVAAAAAAATDDDDEDEPLAGPAKRIRRF